ncbi:hypothetical protein ILUMI_07871 [Ignelater luminosus]|uniref:Inner centromere protein ARK-binding domain-containing protein n=1 Tax=Ignelater luminosus TaxID=2038154 RepID=A0A8K0DCI4_IGNLU|nr:hypothetical protein ILUMI_07871 [Ignelater luminosus]
MSKFDEVVKLYAEADQIALDALKEFEIVLKREKLSFLDAVERDVELFKETGQLVLNVTNEPRTSNSKGTKEDNKEETDATSKGRSSSLKENIGENCGKSLRSSTRPKRNVFTETSQVSNVQANVSVNSNANEHISGIIPNMIVKIERLSEDFKKNQLDVQNTKIEDLKVKQEVNEMPPPLRPPIRQTRKKKGAQNTVNSRNADLQALSIKVEQIDQENKKQTTEVKASSKPASLVRDSDVQIHCEPIHTINLIDSEEESDKPRTRGRTRTKKTQNKDQSSNSEQDNEIAPARVTRTKTRNAAKNKETESDADSGDKQKRVRSSSDEDHSKTRNTAKSHSKRTRTEKATEDKQNENNTSVYEDAISNTENAHKNQTENMEENSRKKDNNNKTHPVSNGNTIVNNVALNETVVVEKPKNKVALMNETIVISKVPENQNDLKDLMTDDEDIVVSPPNNKKTNLKQVFSPYASSPVKQRVQAFEKLRVEANCDLPPRMTRTKTKAKAKEQQEIIQDNANETPQSNLKNYAKQGAIPKVKSLLTNNGAASEKYKQKGYLTNQSSTDNTSISAKPKSAIKSSQAEFRERELKRKQKEAEALSKKEALIQALTEEKKRKREERQIRAQQTRDAIEKDKQKVLESAERIKQEKLKQMLAEKEEKLLKQREEAARKRAIAQKKAAEEKQKEELKRLEQERAKKLCDKDNIPPYLKHETPMLPTEDCYDSDDSNAGKSFTVPAWQKKELLITRLKCLRSLGKQKQGLYCNGPRTVNLKEFFPSIEPHKLKRTSSAIWNRSGVLRLASMAEEGEEGTAA